VSVGSAARGFERINPFPDSTIPLARENCPKSATRPGPQRVTLPHNPTPACAILGTGNQAGCEHVLRRRDSPGSHDDRRRCSGAYRQCGDADLKLSESRYAQKGGARWSTCPDSPIQRHVPHRRFESTETYTLPQHGLRRDSHNKHHTLGQRSPEASPNVPKSVTCPGPANAVQAWFSIIKILDVLPLDIP
jgi:hypothetical protein